MISRGMLTEWKYWQPLNASSLIECSSVSPTLDGKLKSTKGMFIDRNIAIFISFNLCRAIWNIFIFLGCCHSSCRQIRNIYEWAVQAPAAVPGFPVQQACWCIRLRLCGFNRSCRCYRVNDNWRICFSSGDNIWLVGLFRCREISSITLIGAFTRIFAAIIRTVVFVGICARSGRSFFSRIRIWLRVETPVSAPGCKLESSLVVSVEDSVSPLVFESELSEMSVPGVALLSVWRELLLLEALSLFVTDSIILATVSGTLITFVDCKRSDSGCVNCNECGKYNA